jgi:hypothetical protein
MVMETALRQRLTRERARTAVTKNLGNETMTVTARGEGTQRTGRLLNRLDGVDPC